MKDESYEYITAVVDCGTLHWEYKVNSLPKPGRQTHDEDVEDWSEKDIIDLTVSMLGVSPEQRSIIKIEYA